MEYSLILRLQRRHGFFTCAALLAAIFLITSTSAAQAAAAGQREMTLPGDMNKYPGLLEEFGQLFLKLQHNVQFPAARGESRLLPLLPEGTMFYTALPNYGDATHQALAVFRQELLEKAALREWWQHGEVGTTGPKVEESLEKFSQLSQYLGDEIVMSGAVQSTDSNLLIVAEVKKSGLKPFLQQMVKDLAGRSKPSVRVFDVAELAAAKGTVEEQELLVLVRPDLVVAPSDLAVLRSFNERLDRGGREFLSAPFGQRMEQAYQGGATILAGADLQKILKQVPTDTEQGRKTFQRTGFADMKYLVWEHKGVAGKAASQMELSFTGPRHGVASWLAAPAPLGSLDFVSPKAVMAASVVLKDPAEIFEDVKDLATASNPNAFAALPQMERALQLSLKEDLLRQLGGEITLELDSPVQPEAVWKAILRVKDADHLQQTFDKLALAMHMRGTQPSNEGGVRYHTLVIPSPKKMIEIGYAFVDGYLIIASSHENVVEAVRLHKSGESVARAKKFLAALPPGRSAEASALMYEDPVATTAMRLRQVSPELAAAFSQPSAETPPAVIGVHAEDSVIREESMSGGVDAGVVLVVAARSRSPTYCGRELPLMRHRLPPRYGR